MVGKRKGGAEKKTISKKVDTKNQTFEKEKNA